MLQKIGSSLRCHLTLQSNGSHFWCFSWTPVSEPIPKVKDTIYIISLIYPDYGSAPYPKTSFLQTKLCQANYGIYGELWELWGHWVSFSYESCWAINIRNEIQTMGYGHILPVAVTYLLLSSYLVLSPIILLLVSSSLFIGNTCVTFLANKLPVCSDMQINSMQWASSDATDNRCMAPPT